YGPRGEPHSRIASAATEIPGAFPSPGRVRASWLLGRFTNAVRRCLRVVLPDTFVILPAEDPHRVDADRDEPQNFRLVLADVGYAHVERPGVLGGRFAEDFVSGEFLVGPARLVDDVDLGSGAARFARR